MRQLLLLSTFCLTSLLAGVSYAGDCSATNRYLEGANYQAGDQVNHLNRLFRCDVGGWCSQGGAYQPGVGWASDYAWTGLGNCQGSSSSDAYSSVSSSSSFSSAGSSTSVSSSSAASSVGSSHSSANSGSGQCTALPQWFSALAYQGGERVSHQMSEYKAKWWTRGDRPDQSGDWGVWEKVGPCTSASSSSVASRSSSSRSSSANSASSVHSSSSTASSYSSSAGDWYCSSASCLHGALDDVQPGGRIVLAPGTYTGSFSSDVEGAQNHPVTITSQNPENPAVFSGYSTGSGYNLQITGDYWVISHLTFTNAQKGILLDNSNHSLITRVEVYNIGYEAVHFRDGSSYSTIEDSHIHHTGLARPGFGEGVYVGSAESSSNYAQNTNYNTVRRVEFGPGISAEHVDVKERSTGTVIADNVFHGAGISGVHYADSFIDIKGNDVTVRNNTFYGEGNNNIVDAIQLHEIVAGWGNGDIHDNTFHLDNTSVNVIAATGNTSAQASSNLRLPAGSMYTGDVTQH